MGYPNLSEEPACLVIGDPHFKVANVRETDAMVEAIVRTATETPLDFIVVLGDVLDRHETIHVSPLTRATKFLARLMEIAPTYVLIGNHDLKNNRQFLSDEHPFGALKQWGDNMTIVDTHIMATIKGRRFDFVPYVPPGRFVEALDTCKEWEQAACIFAHQEFQGCQMGAIVSTEGDAWPLTHPFVVSGHIHDYQEPQVNILYTGTPIQHAFGDRHDKTISYFTFESRSQREHRRIDLGLPRKQIVRISCAEVSTYTPPDNCELKIIIRGTSGEIKATIKHPSIDGWKRAGYKIVYKDIPLNKVDNNQDDQPGKPLVSKAPLRFSTVLYNTINNNPRLGVLYNKIFGSVRVATSLSLNVQPLTAAMNQLTVSVPQVIVEPVRLAPTNLPVLTPVAPNQKIMMPESSVKQPPMTLSLGPIRV